MTLLLALSSIGTHIVITLPALGVLGGNSRAAPMAESKALRDVALGHVVVVLASMFGVSLQMGNLEVDEVAATAPAQTKKKN